MLKIIIIIFLNCISIIYTQVTHTKTDTIWQVENYSTIEGAVMSIWPHENRMADAEEIKRLKSVFGFSHIVMYVNHNEDKYRIVQESGFLPEQIIVIVFPENYSDRIKNLNGAYAYYLDEPNERNLSVSGIRETIAEYSPGSLFIISGYRRTSGFSKLVKISDRVLFSSYKHWWQCFPGVWCPWPLDYDQRCDWTDMKERFGDKSVSNWVGAHRDTSDYSQLLNHAAELNLNGLWLFQFEDPVNSEKNLYLFCDAAWSAGYMRKFERKHILTYNCTEPGDSECKWLLQNTYAADEMREVKQLNPRGVP